MVNVPLLIFKIARSVNMIVDSEKLAQELALIDTEINIVKECVSSGMQSLLNLLNKDNILDKSKKDTFGYNAQNRENKYLRDRLAMLRKDTLVLEKLIHNREKVKREYEYTLKAGGNND